MVINKFYLSLLLAATKERHSCHMWNG